MHRTRARKAEEEPMMNWGRLLSDLLALKTNWIRLSGHLTNWSQFLYKLSTQKRAIRLKLKLWQSSISPTIVTSMLNAGQSTSAVFSEHQRPCSSLSELGKGLPDRPQQRKLYDMDSKKVTRDPLDIYNEAEYPIKQ
jgi:hypothetical protein